MSVWVSSSGLVDVVIAITFVEVGGLLLYRYKTKRGLRPRDYLLNVLSGLCLMLALRSALTGAAWFYICIWLATAGAAHVTDIALRLRQQKPVW